jgi:hypothetical protein
MVPGGEQGRHRIPFCHHRSETNMNPADDTIDGLDEYKGIAKQDWK